MPPVSAAPTTCPTVLMPEAKLSIAPERAEIAHCASRVQKRVLEASRVHCRAHDLSGVVDAISVAHRTAKRAEIAHDAPRVQKRMLGDVVFRLGRAHDLSGVVDAAREAC